MDTELTTYLTYLIQNLRVTSYKYPVTSYELYVFSYELHVFSYELRVITSYEL
jgi:hypothetical protein